MKFLKQYRLVLSIVLLAVTPVLIRTFSQKNFRYDAGRWAEPSAAGSNIITEDQIRSLTGNVLFVNLGNETLLLEQLQDKIMVVSPGSVLENPNLALIRKNKGPVILYSADSSVSARVWMVLSEMGIKNIYILQIT